MKPIIGVTSGEIYNRAKPWAGLTYGQSFTYTDRIWNADGLPVVIPLTGDMKKLRELYERLDGILFAGGNDIDPSRYGEDPHQTTFDVSPRRDKIEFKLMEWAMADGKPVFCICRGMQVFNIAHGGSLYQDIADMVPTARNHNLSVKIENGTYLAHTLAIESDSRLADILGTASLKSNTHHHQAVKDVGEGLRVTAKSEDGIIEALEKPGDGFALGVQCHPEEITGVEPKWDLVFKAFVEKCHDAAQTA